MIKKFKDKTPKTEKAIFVAENATIIGDVELSEDTSIWFGAVLRADLDSIKLGRGSNVQDNCTLHGDKGYPVIIGEDVTIGHNAVVHGCEDLSGLAEGSHCKEVGRNKELKSRSIIRWTER